MKTAGKTDRSKLRSMVARPSRRQLETSCEESKQTCSNNKSEEAKVISLASQASVAGAA